jgi:hypothetical protein
MSKNIIYILAILFCENVYSQFPEAKEFVKEFDSIKNNYIYYEKFETGKEKILLDNKIIKSKKKIFVISKGLIIEEIEVLKDIKNIEKVFIKYDSLYSLDSKIYCEGNNLRKIEIYKSNKLSTSYEFYKYGITPRITNYEYHDDRYYEYVFYNNEINTYEIKYDFKLQKIIDKNFLKSAKIKDNGIEMDDNGEFYWIPNKINESSVVFDKYCKICNE